MPVEWCGVFCVCAYFNTLYYIIHLISWALNFVVWWLRTCCGPLHSCIFKLNAILLHWINIGGSSICGLPYPRINLIKCPTNKTDFTVLFNKKLQNCYKIKDCQANWAIKKTFRTNSNVKCQKSMCCVTSFSHHFVLHYIGKVNYLCGWKSQKKTKVNVKMAIRPRNLLNDVYTTKALSVLVFLKYSNSNLDLCSICCNVSAEAAKIQSGEIPTLPDTLLLFPTSKSVNIRIKRKNW